MGRQPQLATYQRGCPPARSPPPRPKETVYWHLLAGCRPRRVDKDLGRGQARGDSHQLIWWHFLSHVCAQK